jgi:hypothetical protein
LAQAGTYHHPIPIFQGFPELAQLPQLALSPLLIEPLHLAVKKRRAPLASLAPSSQRFRVSHTWRIHGADNDLSQVQYLGICTDAITACNP